MAAGITNFTINANADFQQELIWTDSNGNPIDLTSYTAKMEVANNTNSNRTIYHILSSSGMNPEITFNASLGIINLLIPASITQTFAFTSGVFDLLLTAPGGQVTRLLQGPVTVSPGVTTLP
jgi:hypothetical protein